MLVARHDDDDDTFTLRNKFDALHEISKTPTLNDDYENFVNVHLEAAAECIPTKQRAKSRLPWETLAVRKKHADVKTASKCNRRNPTIINALKLKKAQNELVYIYLNEQTEYIQNQISKIRDSVEDRQSKIEWPTINKVREGRAPRKLNWKLPAKKNEYTYGNNLSRIYSGKPPNVTDEPITKIISNQLDLKLGLFTQEKIDSLRRKIKNRKATGVDEIPPEVWKTREFDDILLRLCNVVYNQKTKDRCTKGWILFFLKKDDLGIAKNYWGITLISIAAKIYNALLRNCIVPKIEKILRNNQNGFRKNRSTASQILTIHRILEGVRAKNLEITILFADFSKAFDSIPRGKMEPILLAYGLPKGPVAAIMMLYKNTKVKVRFPDGDTDYFDIIAGVLQGDTLAHSCLSSA